MYTSLSAITPPVAKDWFGKTLNLDFRFILEEKNNHILFGAQFPKDCFFHGEPRKFTEGLWAQSVVELFLHEVGRSSYIEINLSPSGAFWAARFSDYRVKECELTEFLPMIEEGTHEGTISAQMSFDATKLSTEKFEVAQTAILANGSDKHYLTRKFAWSNLSAAKALFGDPDFHQKKLAEVL